MNKQDLDTFYMEYSKNYSKCSYRRAKMKTMLQIQSVQNFITL